MFELLLFEFLLGMHLRLPHSTDILPTRLDSPFFWSNEEKELLEGTFIGDRIAADLEGLLGEYNRVFPPLFQVINMSNRCTSTFLWLILVVMCLIFETNYSIFPFIDLQRYPSIFRDDIFTQERWLWAWGILW